MADLPLMFPYRDDNPTLRTPVITVSLIVLNVATWVFVQGMYGCISAFTRKNEEA